MLSPKGGRQFPTLPILSSRYGIAAAAAAAIRPHSNLASRIVWLANLKDMAVHQFATCEYTWYTDPQRGVQNNHYFIKSNFFDLIHKFQLSLEKQTYTFGQANRSIHQRGFRRGGNGIVPLSNRFEGHSSLWHASRVEWSITTLTTHLYGHLALPAMPFQLTLRALCLLPSTLLRLVLLRRSLQKPSSSPEQISWQIRFSPVGYTHAVLLILHSRKRKEKQRQYKPKSTRYTWLGLTQNAHAFLARSLPAGRHRRGHGHVGVKWFVLATAFCFAHLIRVLQVSRRLSVPALSPLWHPHEVSYQKMRRRWLWLKGHYGKLLPHPVSPPSRTACEMKVSSEWDVQQVKYQDEYLRGILWEVRRHGHRINVIN